MDTSCTFPRLGGPFPKMLLGMTVVVAIVVGLVMNFTLWVPSACACAIVTVSTAPEVPTFVAEQSRLHQWELLNGNVKLNDPLLLSVERFPNELKPTTTITSTTPAKEVVSQTVSSNKSAFHIALSKPRLIGAGGGGAVFSFQNSPFLLKVSWEGTAQSVQHECRIMQLLQQNQVQASECCLGIYPYPSSSSSSSSSAAAEQQQQQRIMILVEPYMNNAVATVMDVDESKRDFAVEQIARTLIQMMAANIVTIDVQPLISKETGRVIFIDMTEAQQLVPSLSNTSKSYLLLSSFATEMMTLIPEPYLSTATRAAKQEIVTLQGRGLTLSSQAMQVLQEQTSLLG